LKVYLASSFDLSERVQKIADLLQSKGISVTRKWWLMDYKTAFGQVSNEAWYRKEKVKWVSRENFKAIDQADAVILVCPPDSPHNFTGANIEVGYAIAKNKRVISVGALGRSAMYVPVEKHSSIETLLPALKNED
jgi:nucleoside 2-deoxyribosyltransferase